MRVRRSTGETVVFDAADLTVESDFWATSLDGVVAAQDGWYMVLVDGEPWVCVQLVRDCVSPTGPMSPGS